MAAETGRQKAWWLIDEGWFYQLRMGGIWESILAKGKRENSSPLASPHTLLSTLLRLVNPDTEVVVCHFQGYLPIGWLYLLPTGSTAYFSWKASRLSFACDPPQCSHRWGPDCGCHPLSPRGTWERPTLNGLSYSFDAYILGAVPQVKQQVMPTRYCGLRHRG